MAAQSDIGIVLWSSATGTSATFTKLVDVTSVPGTGSSPGKHETTVLSSEQKTYVADRVDTPDMDFTYNYDAANYLAVKTFANLTTEKWFLIIYGDGSGAMIKGTSATFVNPVSRGSVVEATLTVVASEIDDKTAAEVTALKTV